MYIKRDGMIIKDDYLYIPMDENNRHYQEYLERQSKNPPIEEYVLTIPPKTVFTSLEFRDLFTINEQLAIRESQLTDMEVGLVYDMMLSAQSIDISDPRTVQGMDLLVSKGLITNERRDEILQEVV